MNGTHGTYGTDRFYKSYQSHKSHESHSCPRDFPQEEVKNMKRVRLYELAKELRLEPRQVVADARRFGAMVNSPSSSVDERTANRIRELYFPKRAASGQPRAARLVKAHKPVETPEGPAADRQPEGQAVQESLPGAPEAAAQAERPPRTESRTRIINLTPKPAPMRPAPPTRPPTRALT